MPQIADLLIELKQHAATHDSAETLHLLKLRLASGKCRTYEGTDQDAANFVDWYRPFLYAKQKSGPHALERRKDRDRALERVQNLLKRSSISPFRGIDRGRFSFQLTYSIGEPQSIDQGDTGLCPAAAVMIPFAKYHPNDYAKYAIQMFERGWGLLNELRVEPQELILKFYGLWHIGDRIGECDYVTLASLRNSPAVLQSDERSHAASSAQLCEWLRKAGYRFVEDLTTGAIVKRANRPTRFSALPYPELQKALVHEMVRKHRLGFQVLMINQTEILWAIRDRRPITPGCTIGPATRDVHVSYISKVSENSTHLTEFKSYGWGGASYGWNILFDTFASRFEGFICYKDFFMTT